MTSTCVRSTLRRTGPGRVLPPALSVLFAVALLMLGMASASAGAPRPASRPALPAPMTVPGEPDLGPNVYVFTPSMSTSDIQSVVDAIATQQVPNQFGTQRYALLFMPGTYGTVDDPLNFQVGYYTEVAGLGASPTDVTINGSVYVRNQCDANGCVALNNFWRSLSNLTINVTTPDFGCYSGEFWAVSQAAPMRRVNITGGTTTLMDYCTGPSYASGGFIADSNVAGTVINGSQQQFYVRNSTIGGWSNGVWNQVFSGVNGAPAQCYPKSDTCSDPYTTLATTPVSRGKPFVYVDGNGVWQVYVPPTRTDATGEDWSSDARSIPLSDFFLAMPSSSTKAINAALKHGKNLLLTPGVYDHSSTIRVTRADAVVLGLGFATLTAADGSVPMSVGDVAGVDVAGLIFDAGAVRSPVLLRIGSSAGASGDPADPTALQDVFFRIGGPHEGRAAVSLQVNSDDVVLDDLWVWRADHGSGVGWTQNTANTGVVVNGDAVTATGLFVEHYQKYQVIWNGQNGEDVFFQSELPYDVPTQSAWMSDKNTLGYASFKVADGVSSFTGYGMGTYSFFNQGADIVESHAFEVPEVDGVQLHDLLTVFLDPSKGRGGILHVVNDTGGSSTSANPGTPVTVTDYPAPPS